MRVAGPADIGISLYDFRFYLTFLVKKFNVGAEWTESSSAVLPVFLFEQLSYVHDQVMRLLVFAIYLDI